MSGQCCLSLKFLFHKTQREVGGEGGALPAHTEIRGGDSRVQGSHQETASEHAFSVLFAGLGVKRGGESMMR